MSGPQRPWYEAASARIDEYQGKVRQHRHPEPESRQPYIEGWHPQRRDHGKGLKFEDLGHEGGPTQKLDDRMERTVAGGFCPTRFVTFTLGRPVVVISTWNVAPAMLILCSFAAFQMRRAVCIGDLFAHGLHCHVPSCRCRIC
jgi:hypothetical protein